MSIRAVISCLKIAREIQGKMADNTSARSMASLIFLQFGLFLILILQLQGIMITYKVLEMKRNSILSAYLSVKKRNLLRKRKHLKARRLRRKPKSVWVINGRTDQWWQNLIGANVPQICWKKNLRMSRVCFYQLAEELRPFIAPNPASPNYRYLTTEKKLAVTLYYLKDTGSLWMTANTLGFISVPCQRPLSKFAMP